MKFRAHDTFFIRKGWLAKGLLHVKRDPYVFMGHNENPMDVLGIGLNMVKSLRYWLQATGLTIEPTGGARFQEFTPLGEIIYKHDPYIEELGTLWLLQYHLATNCEEATAWYFFFNKFDVIEFSKDDYVRQLDKFVRDAGESYAMRSYEDDFNCIINTYIPRKESTKEKVDAENNIDSPFGELGLVSIENSLLRTYRKSTPLINVIPPLVFLAVLIDCFVKADSDSNQINISSILNDINSPGRAFNLDMYTLNHLLHQLELLGYIQVVRTAGLDVVRISTQHNATEIIEMYYQSLE